MGPSLFQLLPSIQPHFVPTGSLAFISSNADQIVSKHFLFFSLRIFILTFPFSWGIFPCIAVLTSSIINSFCLVFCINASLIFQEINECIYFFKILFIFFRERGRERERDGEKHWLVASCTCPQLGTWPTTQACALTGNQTGDLTVHRPMLNPLSHTTQGSECIS